MGNKWMVFSDKGAMLTDVLTPPPINNTGSIHSNHNGFHYETILGMHSLQVFENNDVAKN